LLFIESFIKISKYNIRDSISAIGESIEETKVELPPEEIKLPDHLKDIEIGILQVVIPRGLYLYLLNFSIGLIQSIS